MGTLTLSDQDENSDIIVLAKGSCRTDPAIARQFAEVTFLSDNRVDLGTVTVPTLVLQCTQDVIAPVAVGAYVRDACRRRRWCCSTPPGTART